MDYVDYDFLLSDEMVRLSATGRLVFINSSGKMYVDFKPRRLRTVPEKVFIPNNCKTVVSREGFLLCFGLVGHIKSMISLLLNLPCGYGIGYLGGGLYYICHYLEDRGLVYDYTMQFTCQCNMIGKLEKTDFGSRVKVSYGENYYMTANSLFNCMKGGYSLEFTGLRLQRDGIHLLRPVTFKGYEGKRKQEVRVGEKHQYSIVCRKVSNGIFELAKSNFDKDNFIKMVNIFVSYEWDKYALHWDRYYNRWLYVEDYNIFLSGLKTVAFFKDNQKCQIVEMFSKSK